MKKRFLMVALLCFSHALAAAPLTWQALEAPVRAFLQGELKAQGTGYKLGKPGSSIRLPECEDVAVNWPPNVPMSGPTFVEVSCPDKGWSVRYPVTVEEKRLGVVTTRRLMAGDVVGPSDVRLAELPNPEQARNVYSNLNEVVGKVVRSGLPSGIWLRNFMVQAPLLVRANQQVRVVAGGGDFSVMADGIAMNNGALGDAVSVRMPNGRMVRGTVAADGNVQIKF